MSTNGKTRTNRLRKILQRQGFILQKSRGSKDPLILGGYRILDDFCGSVVKGHYYEMDLDSVEEFANQ